MMTALTSNKTRSAFLLMSSALVLAWGCGSGDIGGDAGSGANSGSSGNASGGAGGDQTSGLLTTSGGGEGQGGDSACAAVSQEADLVSRPVDIIFVIDNSGSMGDEIEDVEVQINQNFANILDSAMPAIDYRVIMVSEFGDFDGPESICVSAPLGGIPDTDMDGHCDSIPGQPVETANFFHHSVAVSSHNALCRLLEMYDSPDEDNLHPNGYQDLLREEAFKFFVVITDDGVSCSYNGTSYSDGDNVNGGNQVATDWDTALLALNPTQFGTAMERDYQFWSIISQQEYMVSGMNPLGQPVPFTEPITSALCSSSLNPNKPAGAGNPVDAGTGYQGLSILTEGYRFPTCALDYTDMFTLMAQGVIDGAQVACEFEVPEPPAGEQLDLETVTVVYTSNGTEVATYTQVADATACTPNSFYLANNTITLCPGACTTIQADENAKIDLRFDCKQIVE